MDFKRNVSCFGELPILASPTGCGEGLQSTDMSPFGDVFRIEDLSQFSNEDIAGPIPSANISSTLSSVSSETVAKNGIWASFAADDFSVCHPFYEGIGGEWLSDFVEDSSMGSFDLVSFGETRDITNDLFLEKQQTHAEPQVGGAEENPLAHRKRVLPGGARSKRSRAVAFRGWSYQDHGNAVQQSGKGRKAGAQDRGPQSQTQQPRRCTHCLSQRTPQWRAGPLGPKSLCNACGVRFKSGRLFPEYRPAKSPTFVGSVHSNSHKKVLEMRNQLNDVQTPLESQPMHDEEHQPLKVRIKITGLDDVSSGSN